MKGEGIDFHLQQLQFKASLQFRGTAGPGMSPARAWLPVCGQDFPCGPRDSQAAAKENNYSERREKCARSQTCCVGKRESGTVEVPANVSCPLLIAKFCEPAFICGCYSCKNEIQQTSTALLNRNLGLQQITLGYNFCTDTHLLHTWHHCVTVVFAMLKYVSCTVCQP